MTIRGTRTIQEIFDLCHAPPGMEQEDLRPPSSASTKETWREASETVARAAEQANLRDEYLPRAQRRTLIKEVKQLSSRLRRCANMAKVPIWELLSRDFSKYYYLFGVDDPAKNNIEFWDPHDHRWRVVQSLVLSMGNSHSVPGACRVSEAMRSIYAHAGGICNLYIDDGFIFAPDPEAMEACRECYDTLAGALGLPLSPKDDGNQCSCDIMQDGGTRDFVRGLGVRYVYDRTNNCIYARVPPDVIKKCQEKITIILQQLEAGCLKRKTVQQAIGHTPEKNIAAKPAPVADSSSPTASDGVFDLQKEIDAALLGDAPTRIPSNGSSVGILTPYAAQQAMLKKLFKDYLHSTSKVRMLEELELELFVDTIDGSQGSERDIILFSSVRSNERGEIGFLQDPRRMNVALTRARDKLVVFGDRHTLAGTGGGGLWAQWLRWLDDWERDRR
eukprot:g3330.t1